ncbi:MAG: hypothetical protein R2746_06310 [Acidimicrobiales bacterium]|nr:hypothetical protein [Actinomycetota bacterium]
MTRPPDAPAGRSPLPLGTKVEVRTGFDGSWSSGFVVEAHTERGYRLRRRSDDEVLPVELPAESVRRERKNSMWWY